MRFRRSLAATAFSLFIALNIAGISHAFEVTVVKSGDIKPYNDAVKGFSESCGCSIRELPADASSYEKILSDPPDAVLAVGTEALRLVKGIKNLPLIYTMVMSSEVSNSRQNNMQGVVLEISPEIQLERLLAVFPKAKKIGVVFDPKRSGQFMKRVFEAARTKGVEIVSKTTETARDVPSLIDGMKGNIDAFWMLPDITVFNSETIKHLFLFSFQNRVPVFSFSKKYVAMGAVAALAVDPYDLGVQSGTLAKQIKSGRPTAKTAVNASKAVLLINTKVAAKMGIKIGEDILENAELVH